MLLSLVSHGSPTAINRNSECRRECLSEKTDYILGGISIHPEVNFVGIFMAQIESDFPYLAWSKLISTEVSTYRSPNM